MKRPATSEPRTSRILPAVVVALFALVGLADVAVIVVYGSYHNLVEQDRVEVSFSPGPRRLSAAPGERVERPVLDGAGLTRPDGTELVERDGDRVVVRAPGELVVRFRVLDAGGTLRLGFRFLEPGDRGRCELAVGRLVGGHGVDVVRRARVAAIRRPHGTFRHDLADHVGWFELVVRVDGAAAREGLEVTLPKIDWE